ncbi:hypothetical protein EDD86DRAFT_207091 [Gorgonomyces haynaldii]|nr:hypothetical protein EDD86DRAFT_207091 [Gorgonomyces haynaldii]
MSDNSIFYPILSLSQPEEAALFSFGIILKFVFLASLYVTWHYVLSKMYRIQLTLHLLLGFVLGITILVSMYCDIPHQAAIRQGINIMLCQYLGLQGLSTVKMLAKLHFLFPRLPARAFYVAPWLLLLLHVVLIGPMYYRAIFFLEVEVSAEFKTVRDVGTGIFGLLVIAFNDSSVIMTIYRLRAMHEEHKTNQMIDPQQETNIQRFVKISWIAAIADVIGLVLLAIHLQHPYTTADQIHAAMHYYLLASYVLGLRLPLAVISFIAIQYISFPSQVESQLRSSRVKSHWRRFSKARVSLQIPKQSALHEESFAVKPRVLDDSVRGIAPSELAHTTLSRIGDSPVQ